LAVIAALKGFINMAAHDTIKLAGFDDFISNNNLELLDDETLDIIHSAYWAALQINEAAATNRQQLKDEIKPQCTICGCRNQSTVLQCNECGAINGGLTSPVA
jgi:hypothetical protein